MAKKKLFDKRIKKWCQKVILTDIIFIFAKRKIKNKIRYELLKDSEKLQAVVGCSGD